MTPSENCYVLIRAHERLRLKAYRCPAGVLTIGYGHTRNVKPGQQWTREEAEAHLQGDCADAAAAIPKDLQYRLNQNEFDALVSFIFNVGVGAFATSTMLKKLRAGDYAGAADEFPRWVKSNGKTLPGLVVRRTDERELFLRK